jgi:hypothetical protein
LSASKRVISRHAFALPYIDKARQALAAAVKFDDVKRIRKDADAARAYALVAKDATLIEHATEIRERAKRKGGEMLASLGERRGKTSRRGNLPTNDELGVTHKESHQWQRLAKMPAAQFEAHVNDAYAAASASVELVHKREDAKARKAARAAKLAQMHIAVPPEIQILQGDCREVLRTLADESVHCVVCSPPYYAMRDYGGIAGQVGLEESPDEYIAGLVSIFRDVRRVLRRDGTCWVVTGDCRAGSGIRGQAFPACAMVGTHSRSRAHDSYPVAGGDEAS